MPLLLLLLLPTMIVWLAGSEAQLQPFFPLPTRYQQQQQPLSRPEDADLLEALLAATNQRQRRQLSYQQQPYLLQQPLQYQNQPPPPLLVLPQPQPRSVVIGFDTYTTRVPYPLQPLPSPSSDTVAPTPVFAIPPRRRKTRSRRPGRRGNVATTTLSPVQAEDEAIRTMAARLRAALDAKQAREDAKIMTMMQRDNAAMGLRQTKVIVKDNETRQRVVRKTRKEGRGRHENEDGEIVDEVFDEIDHALNGPDDFFLANEILIADDLVDDLPSSTVPSPTTTTTAATTTAATTSVDELEEARQKLLAAALQRLRMDDEQRALEERQRQLEKRQQQQLEERQRQLEERQQQQLEERQRQLEERQQQQLEERQRQLEERQQQQLEERQQQSEETPHPTSDEVMQTPLEAQSAETAAKVSDDVSPLFLAAAMASFYANGGGGGAAAATGLNPFSSVASLPGAFYPSSAAALSSPQSADLSSFAFPPTARQHPPSSEHSVYDALRIANAGGGTKIGFLPPGLAQQAMSVPSGFGFPTELEKKGRI